MRLWLRASERRAQPDPLATDERVPVLVGGGLWVVAAVVVAVVAPEGPVRDLLVPLTLAGVALGLVLLGYVVFRRRGQR